MFVGDSLTHGAASKSYRWELHKILADNGISYTEVGVRTGNDQGPANTNLVYGKTVWKNLHAAQFGEHAAELVGNRTDSNHLGGTTLSQWLNLDSSGNYHIDANTTPDTYFLMIGTNDLLGTNKLPGAYLEELQANLLGVKENGTWNGQGNMDGIIKLMRQKSGDDVNIVLLTVPTLYAQGSNKAQEDFAGMREYNKALKDWAEQNGLTVVQSDKGVIDVAAPEGWEEQGVSTMFRPIGANGVSADYLHPNAQGDLIIGGNVAKALGYAGRTAGQMRKAANDENFQFNLASIADGGTLSNVSSESGNLVFSSGGNLAFSWNGNQPGSGYTLDFTLSGGLGDGRENGWDVANHFSVSLGNGTNGGTLNINEAYIQWGSTILYSLDTSTDLHDSLRIAFVTGNVKEGLGGGFYVWLDDQLIGEALSSEGAVDGLHITNNTTGDVTLSDLWLDGRGSWAPATSLCENGNPLINSLYDSPYGNFPGRKDWCDASLIDGNALTFTNNTISALASGKIGAYVTSGTPKPGYINNGAHTGDVYVTLTEGCSTGSWAGFHNGNGAFNGNGYLRLMGGTYPQAWFGVVSSTGGIKGDLYMEFSSPDLTITGSNFGETNNSSLQYNVSVAGAFGGSISGELRLVFNAGTFGGDITGGNINGAAAKHSVGSVSIYINGGVFGGNISAGGTLGTVGNRSIILTGDEMDISAVNMITAGKCQTVAASSCTVTGTAYVEIAKATEEGGFAAYTGTLSGGEACESRSLVFNQSELGELKATLANFDSITLTESQVTLSGLAGATTLTVDGDSELTLKSGSADGSSALAVSNSGLIVLQDGVHLKVGNDSQSSGSYELKTGSTLTLTAETQGAYSIDMALGSTLNSVGSGVSSLAITLHGEGSADNMDFDMGSGLASSVMLTLDGLTGDSRVLNMGNQDVTLTGENKIVLKSGKNTSAATALLDSEGALLVDAGNTSLLVDVNSIVDDMVSSEDHMLTYYLTRGDSSALADAIANGSLVAGFDASMLVLGWEVEFTNDGRLVFSRATSVGDVFVSATDTDASGEWSAANGSDIYTEVASRSAVVVGTNTTVDLSDGNVTQGFENSGLLIKNLLGNEADATLEITGTTDADIRVTLSNRLSDAALKALEEKGYHVEDSLTYAGNIAISDATLQVEHQEADSGVGSASSRTIVGGNLQVSWTGDPEDHTAARMKSGVLELRGADNDLGAGDVEFSGYDAQVVVHGGSLGVQGAIVAGEGVLDDAETREHIRLEAGGTLSLGEGSAVLDGVTIGNADTYGGVMAVAKDAAATVSEAALLQNLVLQLAEGSSLSIVAQGADYYTLMPLDDTAVVSPNFLLSGLEGSGKLVTADGVSSSPTGDSGADLYFKVAGGDHTFSGDLSEYSGTMAFGSSSYIQTFSGVEGNSDWNVAVGRGARVRFDLMGASGKNQLEMGDLLLTTGSSTTILLDLLSAQSDSGLKLSGLTIEVGSYVAVGHHEGTIMLEGEDGNPYTKAIGLIEVANGGEVSIADEGVYWDLVGVRNVRDVQLVYDEDSNILYLMGVIDNSNRFAAIATSGNSLAGANMLWSLNGTAGGDLTKVDQELLSLINEGSAASLAKANKLLAAVAGSSTAVQSQALVADVDRQMRAMRNRAASMRSAAEDAKESLVVTWLNAEGNYYKQNAAGTAPGFKLHGWGGTVGAAISPEAGVTMGLSLTAMYHDLESVGPDYLKGDMDTYYLSGMVVVSEGAWHHSFIATAGTASLDATRMVSFSNGSYTTHGSTDGLAFGLMYEVGYSVPLNEDASVCVQPVANISWHYSQLDAYTETGSNAALRVGEQTYSTVTLGMGARMQAVVGDNALNSAAVLETRALVKAHMGDRRGSANVDFASGGVQPGHVVSAKMGACSAELGVGLTVPTDATGAIFIDFSAEVSAHYSNVNATLGYQCSF